MDYLWKQFYNLIKTVLVKNKFFQKNLSYIWITVHGDGLFPIDKNGMPVRNAIISIDTRARNISDQFNKKHKTIDPGLLNSQEILGIQNYFEILGIQMSRSNKIIKK